MSISLVPLISLGKELECLYLLAAMMTVSFDSWLQVVVSFKTVVSVMSSSALTTSGVTSYSSSTSVSSSLASAWAGTLACPPVAVAAAAVEGMENSYLIYVLLKNIFTSRAAAWSNDGPRLSSCCYWGDLLLQFSPFPFYLTFYSSYINCW